MKIMQTTFDGLPVTHCLNCMQQFQTLKQQVTCNLLVLCDEQVCPVLPASAYVAFRFARKTTYQLPDGA